MFDITVEELRRDREARTTSALFTILEAHRDECTGLDGANVEYRSCRTVLGGVVFVCHVLILVSIGSLYHDPRRSCSVF